MQVEIIVILISTLGSLIGTFSGIVVSSKLTAYRLEQLEKKVNKHNNLVERMALAESSLRSVHKRIDEIVSKNN